MKKSKYRIRNWSQYNKALIERGNITVWMSEDMLDNWFAKNEARERGRPFVYSDTVILSLLVIKSVFSLPLRSLQGFAGSLLSLMSVGLPIPSYSQVCRRAKALGKELKRLTRKKITDVVIDSTGLKVYGEGEWKVRQHGASKRRTWRKVHLAVCPDSQEIVLSLLTENSVSDDAVYQQFAPKLPKTVNRVFADGAYDTKECYQASFEQNIDLIAPPQRNAVERANAPPHMQARNDAVRVIDNLEIILGDKDKARKIWKQLKGYHKRSLAETAMFRFKCLFGDRLSARVLSTQKAEVYAKCLAMNTMTKLGMPKGEWVVS